MEYIVYKIVCDDLEVKYTYVGSTMNFTRRKCQHKKNSNNKEKYGHQKVYNVINEHGGWNNWSMIKIESYICETTLYARIRERYWYEELNANMNMVRPMCTTEEAKVYASEWSKEYYNNNKITIIEKNKQYSQLNKEKISARNLELIICKSCNCYNSKQHIARHNKTKKHQHNIELV